MVYSSAGWESLKKALQRLLPSSLRPKALPMRRPDPGSAKADIRASHLPSLTKSFPSLQLNQRLPSIFGEIRTENVDRSKPRLVVIGSGWGGYCFLKAIDRDKFSVSVISPSNHFLFTPLLPSTAVGTLEFRAIQEPIRAIPKLGAFFDAKAVDIDFKTREITCDAKAVFPHEDELFKVQYDYLIVSCGSKTNTFNIPGILERENKEVFFLKHLFHARMIRNRIVECFERADAHFKRDDIPGTKRLLSFLIVGGGPTSVEFVGELEDLIEKDMTRMYPELRSFVKVTLVEAGPRLLPSFHPTLSEFVRNHFSDKNVKVYTGVAVSGYDPKTKLATLKDLNTKDIVQLPIGAIIWSAGLQPVNFINNCFGDFEKGPAGRVAIDEYLRPIIKPKPKAAMDASDAVEAIPGKSDSLPVPVNVNQNKRMREKPVAAELSFGNPDMAFKQADVGTEEEVRNSEFAAGRVFVIGDCGVNPKAPLAPLAIVAKQQGQYIAKQFNSGQIFDKENKPQPFTFQSLFSMVTFGSLQGAVDFTSLKVGSRSAADVGLSYTRGLASFLTWRSAYWGMQTSWANKILIPMFWFKSYFFGRDISRF